MPITVTCQCKKSFQAPDLLAGKTVKCPNCASPLAIPSPAAQDDLFDELADLAAAAEYTTAAEYGLGGSGGKRGGGGLGGSPLSLSMHRQKKSLPLAAIVGAGAVAVVLVVVLFVLLLPGGSDRPRRRAAADNAHSTAATQPEQATSTNNSGRSAAARSDRTATAPPPSRVQQPVGQLPPEGQMQSQDGTSAAGSFLSGFGSLGRILAGDAGTTVAPGGDMLSPHFDPKLRPALIEWHGSGKLVSTRRASESEVHEAHYGWMVGLLPHLGYQEHYDKFDFEKPWHDEANREHAYKEIPEFLNPADDRKAYEGYRYTGMGLTHFVGVSGIEDRRNVVAAALPRSDPRAGIFGYEEIATPREIKDGTSRTLMMIGSGELACPWVQSGGSTVRGAREPYFGDLTGFGTVGGQGKGAIAVMADGSVRWINADVDPQVFRAMCTIGAGD
jgi:hypothetical protein